MEMTPNFTLTPRRSLWAVMTLAAVAIALVFYAHERRTGSESLIAAESHTPVNSVGDKKASGLRVKVHVHPTAQNGFSQKKYDLLWHRYKPNTGLADGPLSRAALDNLAALTKNNTQDKQMWPVFRDVIYGDSPALETQLDTGLRADSAIYLQYPYNTPVSLLDMAIKAGQRGIVQVLLRHSASVGPFADVAPDGTPLKVEAPLPLAAADGEDDVVRLLLQGGANIEQGRALQTQDQTALDAAVIGQNVSTAYLLLTHGADVRSALRPDGTVPDVLTARYGNLTPRQAAVRELLIQYGAKMPSQQ
jgi:Ankyrin repeats (3 copies)